MTTPEWKIKWSAYLAAAATIRAKKERIQNRQHDKGWALAATVDIPRHMCALHNASIDDKMTGWCHDNPHRLAVAKQAAKLVNDWRASRIAEKMLEREYAKAMS